MLSQLLGFELQAIEQGLAIVLQGWGAIERAAVEAGTHVVEFHPTEGEGIQGDGPQACVQVGEVSPRPGWRKRMGWRCRAGRALLGRV